MAYISEKKEASAKPPWLCHLNRCFSLRVITILVTRWPREGDEGMYSQGRQHVSGQPNTQSFAPHSHHVSSAGQQVATFVKGSSRVGAIFLKN